MGHNYPLRSNMEGIGMVSRPSQQKRPAQIPDGGWPAVSVDSDFQSRKSILAAGGVSVRVHRRAEGHHAADERTGR